MARRKVFILSLSKDATPLIQLRAKHAPVPAPSQRRGVSRRSLLGLALLPLAGCGFHPLYSEAVRRREDPELASILIAPIKDRYGQELELALREELNPEGLDVKPRYQLRVGVTTIRSDLGIQRDASSTRARIDAYATLILTEFPGGKRIYTSRTQSTSAFNILEDGYAAQVAEEDARTRTVRDLAEEIRTRLALFLRDQPAAHGAS
jgi:LPS-assembly lipoprotein